MAFTFVFLILILVHHLHPAMDSTMNRGCSKEKARQSVKEKIPVFCATLDAMPTADLIWKCRGCDESVLYYCSSHTQNGPPPDATCHHFRLMFTEGACRNSGKGDATAGLEFWHIGRGFNKAKSHAAAGGTLNDATSMALKLNTERGRDTGKYLLSREMCCLQDMICRLPVHF